MSGTISDRAANLVTGGVGLAFSLAYINFARGIEDSLLADAVGASGVPVSVGALMAIASAALLVKGFMPMARPVPQQEEAAEGSNASASRPHWLAAGLLLILAVYLLALPWLGYVVSIGLMAAAVGWFAGGRDAKVLLGFTVFTGPILWFLFDFALKVRMPAGIWPALFSG
jgi:hypothetical protein